jgi:heavy metal translocating P-type ATPase
VPLQTHAKLSDIRELFNALRQNGLHDAVGALLMGEGRRSMSHSMTAEVRAESQPAHANRINSLIAGLALGAIGLHLLLRLGLTGQAALGSIAPRDIPLMLCLASGGLVLVVDLVKKLFRGEFGSDLLAGISIATSVLLGEYLAGCLVVLMLSGGEALEGYAVRSASSVLEALARRIPSQAHRKDNGDVLDVPLDEVGIGDVLVVFPHEICPVDGTVVAGTGVMDESYLTGEPYMMSKTPGTAVLSGAINGESALTIRAEKLVIDSRYAKIMQVMRASEQHRPRLRRLGDQLGAFYTPLAVAIALAAWAASGDMLRFLAVLVVATPCPLLIAIPVAIVGSISLSARRGIIIKNPAILETIDTCRTAIFDKTGTLTYGRPKLTEVIPAEGFTAAEVLALAASVERYSKHPLASALVEAAEKAGQALKEATTITERPGQGLRGTVADRTIQITSRQKLVAQQPDLEAALPPTAGGLECVALIDDRYAATIRFRDQPRAEGASFINHLGPKHHFDRVMLVSGDRESEVRYLAEQVGIDVVFAGQTPEQKLNLVREETRRARTVFLGDGINDAPALTAATAGIAFGQNSDVTAEAAGAVILDSSLLKVDEFLHISHRMRSIALESALGGMALSLVGMTIAAAGYLPPVAGAILQEVIDVFAVLNALRAAIPPRRLSDY